MAARTRLEHTQATRDKIRTSMIINRLQDHILGEVEMSASQITAALGLIKKTLPDLKVQETSLEVEGDIRFGWHDSHTVQSENTTGEATPKPE